MISPAANFKINLASEPVDFHKGYGPFDIFDDLLARAFARSSCLSHVPLMSGYDEPETLS